MTKLTDTQLIVLSRASQRDDGAAIMPETLNKPAAAKVGASLIARKVMQEVRAEFGMPIWRTDEDGCGYSLIITRIGREAIGVADDIEDGDASTSALGRVAKPVEADRQRTAAAPRAGSKQALVIDMLSTGDGASIGALVDATGWLPHTTRAALTGLRKRGFTIERERHENKGSLYKIVDDRKPSVEV